MGVLWFAVECSRGVLLLHVKSHPTEAKQSEDIDFTCDIFLMNMLRSDQVCLEDERLYEA